MTAVGCRHLFFYHCLGSISLGMHYMRKILTIALREYRAMVATKAFALSIVMMPILMGGSLLAMKFLSNSSTVQDRTIAVIDHTGKMLPALQMAVMTNNATLVESNDEDEGDQENDSISFSQDARYTLRPIDADSVTDQTKLELSNEIRDGDLYAIVEIPTDVQHLKPDGTPRQIKFYSEDSGISETKGWVSQTLNDRILAMRLQGEGIDFAKVQQARLPVRVVGLSPLKVAPDGSIMQEEEKDELSAIMLPMGMMMLMFMITLLAAQPMLESVLEEKSQRIAEVLLGSANPSQLMAGKLLGVVGGSLTIFTIYMAGSVILCQSQGYMDLIPFRIIPWFVVFQVFGVLLYASIFMAVGASVSQLKEAQSMLLPVWMMLMTPMFVWLFVVRDPNGAMATWLSLFPPATPSMMVLRMSTGATIPLWQPMVGAAILAVTVAIVVVIAGRIFRVGILWSGKTPNIQELLQWAIGR